MRTWKRSISVALVWILVAQPMVAAAVTEVELYEIPEGRLVTEAETGTKYRGFTVREWVSIVTVDQKLRAADVEVASLKELLKKQKSLTKDEIAKVEIWKMQSRVNKSEAERLYKKWKMTDDKLQKRKHGSLKSLLGSLSLIAGGALALVGGIALVAAHAKK